MGYVIYFKSTGGGIDYYPTKEEAEQRLNEMRTEIDEDNMADVHLTTWADYEYVVRGYTEDELVLKRFVEHDT